MPGFGAIEKGYRRRGEYWDISVYVFRLRRVFRGLIAALSDITHRLLPSLARSLLDCATKLRHLTPACPENPAT